MALADRLARAVSTTAFRMAAVTAAAYLAFAGIAVGLLLWQTNRVLTNEVLTTLHAEAEVLKAEAQAGDKAALVRAVEARSRPGGPGLYYLGDASGAKLAGNLSRLPPEILGSAGGGVFRYAPDALAGGERLAAAIPVALPDGAEPQKGRS